MRNTLRNLIGALAAGLFLLGLGATISYALLVPALYPPRMFNTQQKHYIRFVWNFNSCVLSSNQCSLKIGSVPVNAFLTDIWIDPTTAFNSAGNDTLHLGTCSGTQTTVCTNHGILAGATNNIQGSTLRHFCNTSCGDGTFAGIALAVTNATNTGANGGFDIFVNYVQTSTAPTAGVAVVIIEYIAPNDGSCSTTITGIGVSSPAVC
jgi:hypothetical protein